MNPKLPFTAIKRAFEVNKGRADVSTSRYERILKFDSAFVTGVEVFVTLHSCKGLCAGALWSSDTSRIGKRPFPIVWKIQTGFVRTVWSGLNLSNSPTNIIKTTLRRTRRSSTRGCSEFYKLISTWFQSPLVLNRRGFDRQTLLGRSLAASAWRGVSQKIPQ